jgi:NAD(P)-dependent dehydrogenase (short-subunit alcohol dehydrogenase family)
MEMQRLRGKVAIVTGAGSGLGAAAAARFAAEGASVFCADLDRAAAERVAGRIEADGGRASAQEVDVTSPASQAAMVATTLAELGGLDIVYANAGIPGEGRAAEVSPIDWEQVIGVDLSGVFYTARATLPALIERGGGAIVNQASVAGLVALPGLAPYSAAKGGVVALTRQMALDYAPQKIRVNAICPGTVPTPLVEAAYERRTADDPDLDATAAMEASRSRVPLGRLGSAEDVAGVAAFLASDEGSWVTGAVYTVDGGMTLTGGRA